MIYLDSYRQEIIDWAILAHPEGREGFFSEENALAVWECVEEELFELKSAIEEDNEEGIIDGLCDSFVTLVQLIIMLDGQGQDKLFYNFSPNPLKKLYKCIEDGEDAIDILKRLMNAMISLSTKWPIEECLVSVLESNDSKFPEKEFILEHFVDVQDSIDYVDRCYNQDVQQYRDIIAIEKEGRLIYRADNGRGKILKPFGYRPPKIKQILEEWHKKELL